MDTSKIIERLGGTAKAAALFQVTPSAVSQWQENGIPKARLMFLELARPDIFKDDPAPVDPSSP